MVFTGILINCELLFSCEALSIATKAFEFKLRL